jgi:hypothetical protein
MTKIGDTMMCERAASSMFETAGFTTTGHGHVVAASPTI